MQQAHAEFNDALEPVMNAGTPQDEARDVYRHIHEAHNEVQARNAQQLAELARLDLDATR